MVPESPSFSSYFTSSPSSYLFASAELPSVTVSATEISPPLFASDMTVPSESESHATFFGTVSATLVPTASSSPRSPSPTGFAATSILALSSSPSEPFASDFPSSESAETSRGGTISMVVNGSPELTFSELPSISIAPFTAPSRITVTPSLSLSTSPSLTSVLDHTVSFAPHTGASPSSSLQFSPSMHSLSVSSASSTLISRHSSSPSDQDFPPATEPTASYTFPSLSSASPSFATSFPASNSASDTQYTSSPIVSAIVTNPLEFTVSLEGEETPFLTSNSENPLISGSISNVITPSSSFFVEDPSTSMDVASSSSLAPSAALPQTFSVGPSISTFDPNWSLTVPGEPSDSGGIRLTPSYTQEALLSASSSQLVRFSTSNVITVFPSHVSRGPSLSIEDDSSASFAPPVTSLSSTSPEISIRLPDSTETPSVYSTASRSVSFDGERTPTIPFESESSLGVTSSPAIDPSSSHNASASHHVPEKSTDLPDPTMSSGSSQSQERSLEPHPSLLTPSGILSDSPDVSGEVDTGVSHTSLVNTDPPIPSENDFPTSSFTLNPAKTNTPTSSVLLSLTPSATLRRSPSHSKVLKFVPTRNPSLGSVSPSNDGIIGETPFASPDTVGEHSLSPSVTPRQIDDRPKNSFSSETHVGPSSAVVDESESIEPFFPSSSLSLPERSNSPSASQAPVSSQLTPASTELLSTIQASFSLVRSLSPTLTSDSSYGLTDSLSQSPIYPSLPPTTGKSSPSKTITFTAVAPASTMTEQIDETPMASAWDSPTGSFFWSESPSFTVSLSPDPFLLTTATAELSSSKVTASEEPSSSHEIFASSQGTFGLLTRTPLPFPSNTFSAELSTSSEVSISRKMTSPSHDLEGFGSESLEPSTSFVTTPSEDPYPITPSVTFSTIELPLTPAGSSLSPSAFSNDLAVSADVLSTPGIDSSYGLVTVSTSVTAVSPMFSVTASPEISSADSSTPTSIEPSVFLESTVSSSLSVAVSVPIRTAEESPFVSPEHTSETLYSTSSPGTSAAVVIPFTDSPSETSEEPDTTYLYGSAQPTYTLTVLTPSFGFSSPSTPVLLYTNEPSASLEIVPSLSYVPTVEQSNGNQASFFPSFSLEPSPESSELAGPSTSLLTSLSSTPELSIDSTAATHSEDVSSQQGDSPEPSSLTLTPSFISDATLSATPFLPSSTAISFGPTPDIGFSGSLSLSPSVTEDLTNPTLEADPSVSQTVNLSEEPSNLYTILPSDSVSSSPHVSTSLDEATPDLVPSIEVSIEPTGQWESSTTASQSPVVSSTGQVSVLSSVEPSFTGELENGFGTGSATTSPTKDTKLHPSPPQRPPSKTPTPSKGSIVKNPTPSSGDSEMSDSTGGGVSNDGSGGGNNGLPLGIGGTSAIAIVSFFVFLTVIVVAYKTCAVIPNGSGFSMPSIFGSSDDEDASGEVSELGFGPGTGDDSPWDQVWQNASDLPEGVQREGEAAAAQVGGQFAGLLKPGGSRVRPPQVITRLAIPGMFTTLSQLSPDTGSSVMSVTTGFSYDPTSQEGSRLHDDSGLGENTPTIREEVKEKLDLDALAGAADAPKVDLLFVFDASGALSWRDYRKVKEVITKPHGLIDEITRRAHDASRFGFIEYAYDSVVVSELDREKDSVRRRILSSFQGDANNWDEEGMYIYEVGSTDGGNVLRKVSSVVTQEQKSEKTEVDDSVREEPGSVNVKEVPPAMNGMSREVHIALKWSRFEMLPPVVNKRIQAQLQNAVRRRRVVVINGGEFTKGGHSSGGIEAAIAERKEMERVGIRVITVGIGEDCDKELGRVGSRRHHVAVTSVEEFEGAIERITRMVMAADNRNDGLFRLPKLGVLKRRQRESEEGGATKSRRKGDTNPIDMDNIKTISKGLPRRASELPPWYTDGLE